MCVDPDRCQRSSHVGVSTHLSTGVHSTLRAAAHRGKGASLLPRFTKEQETHTVARRYQWFMK